MTIQYTCIATTVSQRKSKKRAAGEDAKITATSYAALGSEKGVITIFNLHSGEILHRFGAQQGGHTSRVNDLVFNKAGNTLISCSEDRQVLVWNMSTGTCVKTLSAGKHAVSRLRLSPDEKLLAAAGSSIRLLELESGAVRAKYAGHATPTTVLEFTQDGRYFVSGSDDRYLSIWQVPGAESEAPAKKGKGKTESASRETAVHTITLDAAPVMISINKQRTPAQGYHILALSNKGMVSLWEHKPAAAARTSDDQKAGLSVRPNGQISVSSAAAPAPAVPSGKKRSMSGQATRVDESDVSGGAKHPIFGAQFSSSRADQILVVRGSTAKPFFQTATYWSSSGSFITSVGLPDIEEQQLVSAVANTVDRAKGAVKTTGGTVVASSSSSLARTQMLEPAAKRARVGTAGASDASAQAFQTLAERLAAANAAPVKDAQVVAPRVGTLQSILTQALHSNDDSQLEYVLTHGTKNESLVQKTVERLSAKYVVGLLEAIVARFERQPSRGVYLTAWLKSLLRTHTSLLMSLPHIDKKLAGLYSVIDQRLAVFKKLLKLQGRLDLVMAQVTRQSGSTASLAAGMDTTGPLNVYLEDEADDHALMGGSSDDPVAVLANRRTGNDHDDDDDDEDEEEEGAAADSGADEDSEDGEGATGLREEDGEDEDDEDDS